MFGFKKQIIKNYFSDEGGFGLSESILSLLMLTFITTYALYFVSLRQKNLYESTLNNAINDEIRRDIEKLKSELWYHNFKPKSSTNPEAYYSTINDQNSMQECTDVLRTFSKLPSWSNRIWQPGSNRGTYSGQKRNKIFSGSNVRIERKVISQRPFNMGNDSQFDRSLAEITYNVTRNNKTSKWTSVQLSSEADTWCPPYSR
tara:strand:- start:569 stop:1174 length:606 start_codon:yes stop_codon:yes gene_type:complete